MDTKIKRWGNSQGIILPKNLLAKMNIDNPDGQQVSLSLTADNRLIIAKGPEKSKIDQLFENFDYDDYRSKNDFEHEFLTGPATGKEIL